MGGVVGWGDRKNVIMCECTLRSPWAPAGCTGSGPHRVRATQIGLQHLNPEGGVGRSPLRLRSRTAGVTFGGVGSSTPAISWDAGWIHRVADWMHRDAGASIVVAWAARHLRPWSRLSRPPCPRPETTCVAPWAALPPHAARAQARRHAATRGPWPARLGRE